jgi:hypothetical protein
MCIEIKRRIGKEALKPGTARNLAFIAAVINFQLFNNGRYRKF